MGGACGWLTLNFIFTVGFRGQECPRHTKLVLYPPHAKVLNLKELILRYLF
jgi:hypothetical protein